MGGVDLYKGLVPARFGGGSSSVLTIMEVVKFMGLAFVYSVTIDKCRMGIRTAPI